jgi:hypothetical protein
VKRTKNNNFSHSAPPQAPDPGRIGIAKTVAQFAAAHLSGRIANQGSLCQAKRLPEAITSVSGRCCGSEVHDQPKRGRFGDQLMRETAEKIVLQPVLIQSEQAVFFVLTRFLHANRCPLRSKTLYVLSSP